MGSPSHNRAKSPGEIEIAPGYSINDYIRLKKSRDAVSISRLIKTRFHCRYFAPLGYSLIEEKWSPIGKPHINSAKPTGWLMTAASCFAIEALLNFQHGTK